MFAQISYCFLRISSQKYKGWMCEDKHVTKLHFREIALIGPPTRQE